MADGVTVRVTGMKELAAKLQSFGPKLARNGLRAAVSAGAEVIRKDVQARAPEDTGVLRRAVYKKQIREESNNTKQTFYLGVRSGKKYQKKKQDAFYWRFLEFGTKHIAARPFVRSAFESKKNEAVERMKEKLAERIKKIAGEK